MGRRKKEETVVETPVEMTEEAMNMPEVLTEEKADHFASTFKKVSSPTAKINVRDSANGDVLFTIDNNSKVIVEEEKNGWCKISGYVMAELLADISS